MTEQAKRRGRQAEAQRNDRLVLGAAREVFASQGGGAPVSAADVGDQQARPQAAGRAGGPRAPGGGLPLT